MENAATKEDLQNLGNELMEFMRQIETNLLTEFHRYATDSKSD